MATANVQAFLSPEQLVEAGVYWGRALTGQVVAHLLPDWEVVTKKLARLLESFFSE